MNIDNQWVGISCPKCQYQFEVQFVNIKLEERAYCNNCKATIKLVDQTASAHHASKTISIAFQQLANTLKKLK